MADREAGPGSGCYLEECLTLQADSGRLVGLRVSRRVGAGGAGGVRGAAGRLVSLILHGSTAAQVGSTPPSVSRSLLIPQHHISITVNFLAQY